MSLRHQRAVCRNIVESAVKCAGADGADLDSFQWAEGPGKGCLHVVRDLLFAKQQHAVFLQGGTYRAIDSITAGHLDQAEARHFDTEFGSERDQFHDATPNRGLYALILGLMPNQIN